MRRAPNNSILSRKNIIESFRNSLKRIKLDYVDIVFIINIVDKKLIDPLFGSSNIFCFLLENLKGVELFK